MRVSRGVYSFWNEYSPLYNTPCNTQCICGTVEGRCYLGQCVLQAWSQHDAADDRCHQQEDGVPLTIWIQGWTRLWSFMWLWFTWSCWRWRSCTCWGSTGRWRRLLNRSSWKEKSCLKGFWVKSKISGLQVVIFSWSNNYNNLWLAYHAAVLPREMMAPIVEL